MAATFVLVVGALGTVGAFDSARKLNLLSERRTSMAHRAQLEIERLQAKPFSELAMHKGNLPSHSTVSTNPDYYVKEGTEQHRNREVGRIRDWRDLWLADGQGMLGIDCGGLRMERRQCERQRV